MIQVQEMPGYKTQDAPNRKECTDCAFLHKPMSKCHMIACTSYERTDKRNVIFIKEET